MFFFIFYFSCKIGVYSWIMTLTILCLLEGHFSLQVQECQQISADVPVHVFSNAHEGFPFSINFLFFRMST